MKSTQKYSWIKSKNSGISLKIGPYRLHLHIGILAEKCVQISEEDASKDIERNDNQERVEQLLLSVCTLPRKNAQRAKCSLKS
ncbi:hypothetical protein [Ornithobacterium rhinotracheale]|uniref:Uncharacterized protein n=1 Tax=Ornithobacterium rhinotracheale (strain ATCC 51463 / DSM 15997 / CCUG 23171 / CIP 104009 / LMG 9086) TaxID=867902 RepID=I4A371_ORNRL|nr:hypothetical protein [Ornithobacterium rhinotracheale]AFL98405.1 hypothetical protein Ornrh_2274 [Ornithobacterium rhinotracheale DSM 15997]AIQ00759.1 hypothetical protein Q785_11525 [Ornithobacterium rhinotracheale ORT-UMN 88]KGB65854.1 hypothetical protein Q787_11055 [Ornithobacterium rhinotracheale H06-030791]MBN3662840.1 hypothetical protein [Ornithobacterium rhinotracheale]MCK0193246.1 hypothetical protein [Ornithobacterium rhinotracheale]